MDILLILTNAVLLIIGVALFIQTRKLKALLSGKNGENAKLAGDLANAVASAEKLKEQFSSVLDAKAEAERIIAQARAAEDTAVINARAITERAEQHADNLKKKADEYVQNARQHIEKKVNAAKSEIALLKQQANEYARQVRESADEEMARSQAANILKNASDNSEKIKQEAEKIIRESREAADLIKSSAVQNARQAAEEQAEEIVKLAKQSAAATSARAKDKLEAAELRLETAGQQAVKIIDNAKAQAESIAGDAYKALQQADQIKASAQAMKNIIEGYGDRYMRPSNSVLDDLAQAYSHTEAGQELKKARERSRLMMDQDRAAKCDYVEKIRRETAVRFVLDAFNGKVDSILSRARTENHGTLTQEIKDASAVVNYHGSAFRSAQINPEYIHSRIDELEWIVRVNQLREQEKEEQRAIKEKIREEERARKEYERAIKEAEREEELVRKALEKAHAQLAKAGEEQRQKYEDQIQQLNQKLTEAEEKNKRALSMAQQTKTGHVYIISNIGSFGENVYKIGMTRRLEPLDRVRELGDASVPFGFDVHAMIWSENAPSLEKALHKKFIQTQINKVNPRKEFFKLTIADVKNEIEAMGLEASWTLAAEAREFRETQAIENKMRDDEAARSEWLRQQLIYEDRIEEAEEEAIG